MFQQKSKSMELIGKFIVLLVFLVHVYVTGQIWFQVKFDLT